MYFFYYVSDSAVRLQWRRFRTYMRDNHLKKNANIIFIVFKVYVQHFFYVVNRKDNFLINTVCFNLTRCFIKICLIRLSLPLIPNKIKHFKITS